MMIFNNASYTIRKSTVLAVCTQVILKLEQTNVTLRNTQESLFSGLNLNLN